MSKRTSIHILIDQKDYDILDAFCPNHGDMSKMIRHLIHSFCSDLRDGDKGILPTDIRAQIEDLDNE